ncbi:MAG TPA: hypothetical protein VF122_04435 [Caulobacteraceae bacterium]
MSLIADIVVSSAAAAFAHFGMTLDVPDREPEKVERSIARTPVPRGQPSRAVAVEDCPDRKAQVQRI